jgi:hypothetical protein
MDERLSIVAAKSTGAEIDVLREKPCGPRPCTCALEHFDGLVDPSDRRQLR